MSIVPRFVRRLVNTSPRGVLDAELALDNLPDGGQDIGEVVEGDKGDALLFAVRDEIYQFSQ